MENGKRTEEEWRRGMELEGGAGAGGCGTGVTAAPTGDAGGTGGVQG